MRRKSLAPRRASLRRPEQPRAPVGPAAAAEAIEVPIDRLGMEGEGVALWNGRALFVPGALPGERVRALPEADRGVQRAQLLHVIEPSPERVTPGCPLAGRCGGCDWLHLAPGGQRQARETVVLSALERFGGIDVTRLERLPTLHAGDAGTRRRADLHWDGKALGFRTRRTHIDVAVEHCPALVEPLAPLPGRLAPLLAPLGTDLRAVQLVSEGNAVAAALELRGRIKPTAHAVALTLRRAGLRGIVLVPEHGPSVDIGRPTLRGAAPLRPEIPLFIRPDAFSQGNAQATPLLVECALGLLLPRPAETALELYAGNGTFSFALSARTASVVAVESSPISTRLAGAAAAGGQVTNVRFVQGEADRVTRGLASEGRRFDLLLADPPRTGAPALARAAKALGVRRVVYVACDAGALGRDAGALHQAGYEPVSLQLVDMFPGTHHVEAVMSFERKSEVQLSFRRAFSTGTVAEGSAAS
jgi:23S rRNA (uracil1939-C5)-methyltransferase